MRTRKRCGKIRRILAMTVIGLVLLLALMFGRPAMHIIGVMSRDGAHLEPTPAGFADDASRLNRTAVSETIDVATDPAAAEQQLADLLRRAAAENLKVSIAGSRHTMGGHTFTPGGIVLNMQPFDRFWLDEAESVLHAQSGARWDAIIPYLDQRGRSIEIMQSNNSFTVGGSISANCHGWQPNRPPIASTVLAFRLMKADGTIVRCSRQENADLFSLVLGGYGLFGVILDVDLRVVPNERYLMRRFVIDTSQFVEIFQREVHGQTEAGMAYARICVAPKGFLKEAVFSVFERSACPPDQIPVLAEQSLTSLKRAVFRGSANSDYGKELRWEAELTLSDRLAETYVSRNQLLNDPVDLYQDRSAGSTDILHEYFIPPEQFTEFVGRMRDIVPRHDVDLMNVTVRHVMADPDSFLRYADQELFALVLLFNQPRTAEADAEMERLTRELVDAALELGGRYYLPYRLHATEKQFNAAYPQAREFFDLKRVHDPHELFQNQFYLKYGKP